jgi:hypothetical protein
MNDLLEQLNVATLIVVALVLAGCVIAIVHPETLAYVDLLKYAGPLVGGLAVGRGIAAHGRK